jgi:putative inorganic carbon (hco3(-)) transporter
MASFVIIRPLCDRLFELARFDVAGHALSYGAAMNFIVIGVAVLNLRRINRSVPPGLRFIWMPFLVITAVAVLYSPLKIDASRVWLTYVSFYAMFALSFVVVKSEYDALLFLKLIVFSSVLPVLYGFFQMLSGIDWFPQGRIESTFPHPNILAIYLVTVVGVILFLMATRRIQIGARLRLLLTIYLIPVLVIVVMTKTRSAWIACCFLFFVYGLIYDRRVLVGVALLPLLPFAIPAISDRLIDLQEHSDYIGGSAVVLNSYAWRQLLWDNAFSYIWERPIFGYGVRSFPFHSMTFFWPAPGTYAHNDFIAVLFETGFVGLLAFVWIFLCCFTWLFRRWRFDRPGISILAAVIMAFLICSYSDNVLEYLTCQWSFWFVIGAVCSHFARNVLPIGIVERGPGLVSRTNLISEGRLFRGAVINASAKSER